jgi:hypothetical protein
VTVGELVYFILGGIISFGATSLWWRRHCSRLAAGEAQRRRDERERIERLTEAAELGGGKSRPTRPPPIEPDPRLDNYVLDGGKRKLTSPVDARWRVIPPPPPPPTHLPGWY